MKVSRYMSDRYKPLLHGGVSKISVKVTEPVIACIGQNGSGKSSMLRELSPYPSTSTDYEKGGSTELDLTHNGLPYQIQSDFSKSGGAHSFKQDGVELNESGTTKVQQGLVEKHLGINPLILSIITGGISICDMSNVERRSLFYSAYPSDLSFILGYHKTVCSKIRGAKANLKMLHEKKLALEDKLIDETEFQTLVKLIDSISTFRVDIDKSLYLLESEINNLTNDPRVASYNGPKNIEDSYINETCRSLMKDAVELRLKDRNVFTEKDTSAGQQQSLKTINDMYSNQLAGIVENAKTLKREIHEFEELSNNNDEVTINELNKERDHLLKSITDVTIDPNLPKLTDYDLTINLNQLNDYVVNLHNFTGEIMTFEKIAELSEKLMGMIRQRDIVGNDLDRLHDQRAKLEARYKREVDAGYNPKCVLPCQLKSNYNEVVKELKAEFDQVDVKYKHLQKSYKEMGEEVNKLSPTVEGLNTIRDAVCGLEVMIKNYPWLMTGMDGSLITVFNSNPTQFLNVATRIIANDQSIKLVESYKKSLIDVEYRLSVLVKNLKPTKEFVTQSLLQKKVQLEKLTTSFEEVKYNQSKTSKELETMVKVDNIKNRCEKMNEVVGAFHSFKDMETGIKFYTYLRDNLNELRRTIDEKQAEIKYVVKDQQSYRIRLNDEVLPSIKELEKTLLELTQLEAGLSPSTGLPHIYLVRFINSIILAANEYIKAVWAYDLQMVPLSESDKLDFSIKLKVNNKHPLKDIKIGSRAQKEMIDLAFIIGLYKQLGLGKQFPLMLDEPDGGMTPGHRTNLLTLLSNLLRQGDISQLFIVNHHATLFTSFANSQIVCLDDGGIVVPSNANVGVSIENG